MKKIKVKQIYAVAYLDYKYGWLLSSWAGKAHRLWVRYDEQIKCIGDFSRYDPKEVYILDDDEKEPNHLDGWHYCIAFIRDADETN